MSTELIEYETVYFGEKQTIAVRAKRNNVF